MGGLRGIIFDKDGTLFDFRATWGAWARTMIEELSGGDARQADRIAAALGFDPATGNFHPDSPVIADTPDEIAAALLPVLPAANPAALAARMNAVAAETAMAPAVPLPALMGVLAARGLALGLVTNDAEAAARAHLARSGIGDMIGFVAGYDSGHGTKPAPGPLLAFAAQHGFDPSDVLMVGDSRHDLVAGQAAGMRTVAVLTGIAGADDLAPLAEAVLPDIGHLPDWLTRHG
jgi:phosphoglycolate phosphatase